MFILDVASEENLFYVRNQCKYGDFENGKRFKIG